MMRVLEPRHQPVGLGEFVTVRHANVCIYVLLSCDQTLQVRLVGLIITGKNLVEEVLPQLELWPPMLAG